MNWINNFPVILILCMLVNFNRESYMGAHVLLNLLNKLGKSDKMQSLLSILLLFRNKF